MEDVKSYHQNVLKKHDIKSLYQEGPDGDEDYYSVLFEDPDRMKIEVVFAPKYCHRECWPNTIINDFDPYQIVDSEA